MLAYHYSTSNSYKFNLCLISVVNPRYNKYVSPIKHSHTFIAIYKATHTHTLPQAHKTHTHTSACALINLYRYTCIYGMHKQPSRQIQKIIIIKTTIDQTRWPSMNLWPEYLVDPYIAILEAEMAKLLVTSQP